MPITRPADDWLRRAGYTNHCFISWPHVEEKAVQKCAVRVYEELKGRLSSAIHNPEIFLDRSSISPGAVWPTTLRRALCESLTMVSIWAPMYFDLRHEWCGLEWATMEQLSNTRLAGTGHSAIIPSMVREVAPLPHAAARIQYVDFTEAVIRPKYFTSPDFYEKMERIVNKIHLVGETIYNNRVAAGCGSFIFPTVSAFAASPIPLPSQPRFPFR